MSKKIVRSKSPFILGRDRFAKIAAVEGITTSKELAADFRAFDAADLPAAERRRQLIRKYGKRD